MAYGGEKGTLDGWNSGTRGESLESTTTLPEGFDLMFAILGTNAGTVAESLELETSSCKTNTH